MSDRSLPKLVFHIGDPKTGTSSIQHALEKKLVVPEKSTIAPWTHGNNRVNAIPLANTLLPTDAYRREFWFEKVRDWLAASDTDYAIISAEAFASVEGANLKKALSKFLPKYAESARVISYVRPHASRFLAAFIQRTKVGNYLGEYQDFLPAIQKQEAIDYLPRFGKWRKVFGDRFVLKPFVRSELRGEDAVTDFFTEVLGDEPFTVVQSVQRNISPSLRTLSGLHLFHIMMHNSGAKFRIRSNMAKAILDSEPPANAIRRANPVLDRATLQKLIDLYREDAKALDMEFFSRPLMLESLEKSIKDADDRPIDLNPALHFDGAELARLEVLINGIAGLVGEDQKIWSLHFQNTRSRIVPMEKQMRKLTESMSHLEKIDALLAETSDILLG